MMLALPNPCHFEALRPLRKPAGQDAAYQATLCAIVGDILHEPAKNARRIAQRAVYEAQRSYAVWQTLHKASPAQALALAETMQLGHLDEIVEYLQQVNRGVVITTLHAGDYLLALLKLRHRLSADRQIYILRKKGPSTLETQVFQHFGSLTHPVNVIRHTDRRTLEVVRALRAGHVVVALFDLPGTYGQTMEVEFLARAMQLVSGPATLATLGQADILPLVCHASRQHRLGRFLAPIGAAQLHAPKDTTAQRNRIGQQLCHIGSAHISHYPEQWQHWFHVPQMLLQTSAAANPDHPQIATRG